MNHSPIADAVHFPCPACGANPNELCTETPGVYLTEWPQGSTPWCHSFRIQVLQFNAAQHGVQLVRRMHYAHEEGDV